MSVFKAQRSYSTQLLSYCVSVRAEGSEFFFILTQIKNRGHGITAEMVKSLSLCMYLCKLFEPFTFKFLSDLYVHTPYNLWPQETNTVDYRDIIDYNRFPLKKNNFLMSDLVSSLVKRQL